MRLVGGVKTHDSQEPYLLAPQMKDNHSCKSSLQGMSGASPTSGTPAWAPAPGTGVPKHVTLKAHMACEWESQRVIGNRTFLKGHAQKFHTL